MVSGRKRLPRAAKARITRAKVHDYLLDPAREEGKEGFFALFGFSRTTWRSLARALLEHGKKCRIADEVDTAFGTRYILEGALGTPDGRRPWVRTVWIVRRGEDFPRLVTAYPVGEAR